MSVEGKNGLNGSGDRKGGEGLKKEQSTPSLVPSGGAPIDIPDTDIEALLREGEEAIRAVRISQEDIDRVIEERDAVIEKLLRAINHTDEAQKNITGAAFRNIDTSDIPALLANNIITEKTGNSLRRLFDMRDKLKNEKQNPLGLKLTESIQSELDSILGRITAEIDRQREAIEEERRNRMNAILTERLQAEAALLEELQKISLQLGHPTLEEGGKNIVPDLIVSRLREYRDRYAPKKTGGREGKSREAEMSGEFLRDAQENAEKINRLHKAAFARLETITGNPKLSDVLLSELNGDRSLIRSVKQRILDSVLLFTGNMQIESPREIVPWQMGIGADGVHHEHTLRFLEEPGTTHILTILANAGNKEAQETLNLIDKLSKEAQVFRMLFGRMNESPFWKAFNERRNNDISGRTEELRRERDRVKKEREEMKEGGRSGSGAGLPTEGFLITLSDGMGAVRIVQKISKKGAPYWEIVYAGGSSRVKVGATTPLDMSSFPSELKAAACLNPVIKDIVTKAEREKRKGERERGRRLADEAARLKAEAMQRKGNGNGKGKKG